jgi:hypothetical protein
MAEDYSSICLAPVDTLVAAGLAYACQITFASVGHNLRLRRVTCGKALPFRQTLYLANLLRAGWKAEPSSLRGGCPHAFKNVQI